MQRKSAIITVLSAAATLFSSVASAASLSYLPKRLQSEKCALLVTIERTVNTRAVRALENRAPLTYSVFMAESSPTALTLAAKPRVQSFVAELNQIDAHAGREFAELNNVRVALNRDATIMQASAYADFGQLNLPLSVLQHSVMTTEERFIVAHEFGHLVYDQHLREFTAKNRLPLWEPEKALLNPALPDLLRRRDWLAQEFAPTQYLGISLLTEEERGAAIEEMFALNKQIHEAELDPSSPHHLLFLESMAFHEVAADAWSLIDSQDPEAWALLAPATSLDHFIRDWRFSNFDALLAQPGVYEVVLADPHVTLMKVRNQLWTFFYEKVGMMPGADPEYDALFLKASMNALAEAQFGLVRARATLPAGVPPKEAALAMLLKVDGLVNSQLAPMLERQLQILREFILVLADGPIAQEMAGVNREKLSSEQLKRLVEQYDVMADLLEAYQRSQRTQTQTVTIPDYRRAEKTQVGGKTMTGSK